MVTKQGETAFKGQGTAFASPEGSRDSRVSVSFIQRPHFRSQGSTFFPFSILTLRLKISQGWTLVLLNGSATLMLDSGP